MTQQLNVLTDDELIALGEYGDPVREETTHRWAMLLDNHAHARQELNDLLLTLEAVAPAAGITIDYDDIAEIISDLRHIIKEMG